jgi:hypothetical protein
MAAAATVIAAAAVLTPAAIAQARPDFMPASPVTNMLSTDMFGTDPILGPVSFSLDAPWWWLGDGANPNAKALITPLATPTTIFEFSLLSFFPGFLQPLAGWFIGLIPNFSICFAGLGLSIIGPYGTVSLKTGAC